jgi:hypothetical protein
MVEPADRVAAQHAGHLPGRSAITRVALLPHVQCDNHQKWTAFGNRSRSILHDCAINQLGEVVIDNRFPLNRLSMPPIRKGTEREKDKNRRLGSCLSMELDFAP